MPINPINVDDEHGCCAGNTCCECELPLTSTENVKRPDPFDKEVHDDYTLHKFCDDCYTEILWEIVDHDD